MGCRFTAALVASALCAVPPAHSRPAHGALAVTAVLGDNCQAIPGYREFRSKLSSIVSAKDGSGLRALFHPEGAMRVSGIGGRASTPDWGFDRPEAGTVWRELGEILNLGCARSGDRLVLPAMATFSELEPNQLILLRKEWIRTEPRTSSRALRVASPGQVVTFTEYDTPDGWTPISFKGRSGYLPTSSMRSPFAIRLELVRFEGTWTIREFGDGI